MERRESPLTELAGSIPREFQEDLERASDLIKDSEHVRLLCHYDGDGTSSAIILATALKRLGIRFHLSFVKALDGDSFRKMMEHDRDSLIIISDAGSDQLRFLDKTDNIVVLDHHFYTENHSAALNINARKYGIDGTRDACGATMAFMMALTLDWNNSDLFPFFISGLLADRQDLGGYTGLNRMLKEHFRFRYSEKHTLNLEGETIGSALVYSTDPFYNGITGNQERSNAMLRDIGIDPLKNPADLSENEKRLLGKRLARMLLSQGVGTEALRTMEADVLTFPGLQFNSRELSSIIDGNSRVDTNGVVMQFFLGDRTVMGEMLDNWKIFKTRLIDYCYRSLSQLYSLSNVNYFYSPESEMAGSIAGTLMLYLAPQDKPLVGFNVSADGTHVSSRGTRRMVAKGLNLSVVMKNASEEVGGSGGGHDIAAGAVIPKGKEKIFIEAVNRILKEKWGSF